MKSLTFIILLFTAVGPINLLQDTASMIQRPAVSRKKCRLVSQMTGEQDRDLTLLFYDPLVLTVVSDSSGGMWYGVKTSVPPPASRRLSVKNTKLQRTITLFLVRGPGQPRPARESGVVSF